MKTARRSIHSLINPVALAVIALMFVTGSFGQETGKSTTGAAREEVKQGRAQLQFAKGTLESIDLLRHQLALRIGGDLRTFTYTADTYIFRGKEKITPDGLKTGETVALRFFTEEDGRVLVRRIKAYGTAQPARAESSVTPEAAK